MRKELVFLGYDKDENEILENVNVYTKNEMINIFEKYEDIIKEKYTCIEVFAPHVLKVNIENIKNMNDGVEFIFNENNKQIEILNV